MSNAVESLLQSIFQFGNSSSDVVQALHDEGSLVTTILFIVFFTGLGYATLYHIIDSPSKNSKKHLWITILIAASLSSMMTLFYLPYSINRGLQSASQSSDMLFDGGLGVPSAVAMSFSVLQAIPSAISAFVITVILFAILVQLPWPRRVSTNCRSLRII